MYLLQKLEALWNEVDIEMLKRVCIRDIRLPNELKNSLKCASDLVEMFDLLSNSPFCNWLEITILQRMAKAAEIPEAIKMIEIFKKCVHNRKCSEVKLYFKKKFINPDYLTVVSTKFNKNIEHLVVADLIEYCQKLETLLELPPKSNLLINHKKGCLEIFFAIPTHWCYYAYEVARSNSLRFRIIHLQHLQIGKFSKIYTINLTERKSAKSFLEKISAISYCEFS